MDLLTYLLDLGSSCLEHETLMRTYFMLPSGHSSMRSLISVLHQSGNKVRMRSIKRCT